MKTFVYYVNNFSTRRGYNQTVTVYQLNGHKQPALIGIDNEINTASSKGPHAAACSVISNQCGHKLAPGRGHKGTGYGLASKNINIFEL